ncbi:MAG: BON domain-containing protein [Waterburya sp.]
MNRLITTLLSTTLLFGAVGCDVARTSGDAPTSVEKGTKVEDATQVKETKEDASSEVRQKQLSSDIRAREERNDVVGNQAKRADSDLESEIRSKLESNIPSSKLTIEAEDGNVKIVGTVPSQKEYDSIVPLAQDIIGVKKVTTDIKVVPSTES